MEEVTREELNKLDRDSYELIDIRDDGLIAYGMIDGALHIEIGDLLDTDKIDKIDKSKKLVFYCEIGRMSRDIDDSIGCLANRECYSLAEGYVGYVRSKVKSDSDIKAKTKKAEESIRKKYHKQLFSPFAKACKNYQLIEDGDHIAVCISGGKDSMLMAKLFQEIQRHKQKSFKLTFLVMDPGYNEENRALIESNAKALGIPITIFESDIFDTVDNIDKSPCYLCARMRRGHLYSKAKELGCNKIALGHHFNDVIETTLLSLFYASEIKTMMPKLHSDNFPGLELIRPLYFVREESIIYWKNYNNLDFLNCACRFTERDKDLNISKRQEMKRLINDLKKVNKDVDYNIYKALDNVNLNCVLGIKKDGIYKSFLDDYDK